MADLLPCPFCRSPAEKLDRFTVRCAGCGAEINAQPGAAVELWNRRAPAGVQREPTDAMVDAGCAAFDYSDAVSFPLWIEAAWRAMWDAARKEAK